ncbi:MAG: IPT/TIG domain-containing protein, partial [Gaiellaceae bacterium]
GSATAVAVFTIVNATQLKATVPANAVSGPLTVTNAGGATSSASFGVLAKVTSFAPTSGVTGTQVTLTGTGFGGATSVTFNGVEASAITSVTPISLKATVPPGATTGPVAITTPGGVGTSATSFAIPLAITGFSPTSGQVGDTVVITGTGFNGVTGVKFGDATAGGTIDSDTQITVTVPPGATDGPIVVANGSLSTRSAASFDVVVVPLASQRITFVQLGSNYHTWRMNGDASGATQLTSSNGLNVNPMWSPDGSKIAFASNRDGNFEIYVMNADGSQQLRLTNTALDDEFPAWSPDGTKLAFARRITGSAYDVLVMNADGTGEVTIAASSADDADPVWSPDGSRIAFRTNRDGTYEIYTMDPDGSDLENVTDSASDGVDPDWSPDGSQLVFAGPDGVFTIRSDGTDLTRLTSGEDIAPSWSDCSRIVFVRDDAPQRGIYVMFEDGTGELLLLALGSGLQRANPDCWEPPSP